MPKNGAIPSKADPEKQEAFLNDQLQPLLKEQQQDKRKVFFVDAAHFVMGAFLGMFWCFERLFLKSSGGRKRYNAPAALSVNGTDWVTITNDAHINSDTIVSLFLKISQGFPGIPAALIMDNARYQHGGKVMDKAREPGIDSHFLPIRQILI